MSRGLVEAVVRPFLDGTLNLEGALKGFNESYKSRWAFSNDVDILTSLLEPFLPEHRQDFSHKDFLGAVIDRITKETHVGILLDPLVKALYNLGYNGFLIDLRPLSEPPENLAYCLGGEPNKEVLTATYWGDVHGFGKLNFHSHLELYGNAEHGGRDALRSEYRFHNDVKYVGRWSESCTFHLQSLESIPPVVGHPIDCKYYIHKQFSEDSIEDIREVLCENMPHFLRQNSLFVLDRSDSWQEVTRE